MNVPVIAPVASPENSCLSDISRISPNLVEKDRVSSVILNRLTDQTPPKPTPRAHVRSSSVRMRFSKTKSSLEEVPTSLRGRSSSSTRIIQLLNKLRPNSKGESALHRAAIRGNFDQLMECLESGVSPDVRDHAGWTPLHEAVLHGHRDVSPFFGILKFHFIWKPDTMDAVHGTGMLFNRLVNRTEVERLVYTSDPDHLFSINMYKICWIRCSHFTSLFSSCLKSIPLCDEFNTNSSWLAA